MQVDTIDQEQHLVIRHSHWGIPDPAAVSGTPAEVAAAFAASYRMLRRRIELLIALPVEGLDRLSLQTRLKEIGELHFAAVEAR